MNSLRARLILGFSLVAVLPLGLALLLLGQRIQSTVRAQAAARLESAMGVVQAELAADGERLAARLDILARDPQLKRLWLVETASSGPELRQSLADQRFLLGLDYLAIADTAGHIAADAAGVPVSPLGAGREIVAADALPIVRDSSLAVVSLPRAGMLALDACAPIPYLGERVGFVRGGTLLDLAFLTRLKRSSGLELVLQDAAGHVVASTLEPGISPEPAAGTAATAVRTRFVPATRRPDSTATRVVFEGHAYLMRTAALGLGGIPAARISALASTATADDAESVLRFTALLLGGLGVLLAVVLGVVWSHQVSRPVERLAAFSERLARGEWDDAIELHSLRELQTLVDALDHMRRDLRTYRDHLKASERQAAYGQMARKVAHEIKNPLTPIALSVAGLQRAHEQRHPDFDATLKETVRVVGEEVQRLRNLLQEFSDLGRFPSPRPSRFTLAELFVELRALYVHEVDAGRLAFECPLAPLVIRADRDQLRQALINLVQNALDASAGSGHVRVSAAAQGPTLRITVSDEGPGLSEGERAQLFVPGFTTKAHGSGLGLTIVERIVSDHGGSIEVESAPGRGTTFVVRLPLEPEGPEAPASERA